MTKRILIIENDPFILELLSDLLTHFGYSVEKAPSGSEAMEKINREEFDGILLDIQLYDMDGRHLYRALAERSSLLAGKVVFVTGDLGNANTMSFIKETGNLCLAKPFTIIDLKKVLASLFQEKRQ